MSNKYETLQEAIVNILKHYSNEDLNEGKQILNEGFKSKDLGEIFIEDETFDEDFPLMPKHYKLIEKAVKAQFKNKFDIVEAIVGDDEKVIGISLAKNNVDMNYLADLIDGKDKIDSDVTFDVEFGLVVGDFWFTVDRVDGVNPSKLTKFNRIIEAKLVKILRELTKTFF